MGSSVCRVAGLCALVVALAVFAVGCASPNEPEQASGTSAEQQIPDDSPPQELLGPAEIREPGEDVVWSIKDADSWPSDLLDAAQAHLSQDDYRNRSLSAVEVAATSDGVEWAAFTAGVTDWPEFEVSEIVMQRPASGEWTLVTQGTGNVREDVLPPELVTSEFADWMR